MAADSSRVRQSLLAIVAPLVAVLVAGGTFLADRLVTNELERAALDELGRAAQRAATQVSRYLADNEQDLATFAGTPAIVAAARAEGARAARLGLPGLPVEILEDRFAATRVLSADLLLQRYLESFQQGSDLAEIFFTDRHGLNVAASNITSDFVQSDETWWREAWEGGRFVGAPEYDESAGVVALEISVRIDDPTSGEAQGVVKGLLRLTRLAQMIGAAVGQEARIEVVDAAGRVLVSRDTTRLLRTPPEQMEFARGAAIVTQPVSLPDLGDLLVATAPANQDAWWVVVTQPRGRALALAGEIRRILLTAGAVVLVLVLGALLFLSGWLTRSVTVPVRQAAAVAARVAEGDLTAQVVVDRDSQAEVASLLQAIREMLGELKQLVSGIRGSAEELAAMAQEISASTEEMSASTEEMAATSQRLSDQSGRQADEVRQAATDAQKMRAIATRLADGARLASERSAQLRTVAGQHRGRLVGGSEQLARLASEIAQGAGEARTLAELSTEIQKFVVQAKSVAHQTNMLALNAAIEAARAGGEGRGFAVVADEVRKLATQAARGATATADTVGRVLEGVGLARERLDRLAEESAAVRAIADAAAQGLGEVTDEAQESSRWAEETAAAATEARHLVEEISERLQAIADSTQNFVAAVEEIAASAEEQSASTEEIASSAAQLAETSEKLNQGVSRFRLP